MKHTHDEKDRDEQRSLTSAGHLILLETLKPCYGMQIDHQHQGPNRMQRVVAANYDVVAQR